MFLLVITENREEVFSLVYPIMTCIHTNNDQLDLYFTRPATYFRFYWHRFDLQLAQTNTSLNRIGDSP